MKKNAFTMIEIVFVIVILGILAAIAIPKFAVTRTDAQVAKGRSDIAAIRSAILSERQSRIVKGETGWISGLSDNTTTLFTGDEQNLLLYGIKSGNKSGEWYTTDSDEPFIHYSFKINDTACAFTYDANSGKFELNENQDAICDKLVE